MSCGLEIRGPSGETRPPLHLLKTACQRWPTLHRTFSSDTQVLKRPNSLLTATFTSVWEHSLPKCDSHVINEKMYQWGEESACGSWSLTSPKPASLGGPVGSLQFSVCLIKSWPRSSRKFCSLLSVIQGTTTYIATDIPVNHTLIHTSIHAPGSLTSLPVSLPNSCQQETACRHPTHSTSTILT